MTIIRLIHLILCLFPIMAFSENSLIDTHELTLNNGLKVCLKATPYKEDEVVFELFAMGGYSALAKTDRPSAIIAPEIVWKSGLGDHTGDALTFRLYQRSIELGVKIRAFDRLIEGCSPSDALEECFHTIKLFFTVPKFEQSALKSAIIKRKDSLKVKNEIEPTSKDVFIRLNTQNWDVLNPLTIEDLEDANLYKAEKCFNQFFSNPADFTFVIVGDFEIAHIQPLLEKTLGSIRPKPVLPIQNPPLPSFLAGVTKIEKLGFQRCYNKQSITRLTFPILVKIEGTENLNLICQIIKNRLYPLFPETDRHSKWLEISYEFPFFPRLDEAWLTIQFCSSSSEIDATIRLILEMLGKLQNQGVSEEEISQLQYMDEEKMGIEENIYLLSFLSNYYRANWAISHLYQKKNEKKLEKEMIKNHLNDYFSLDHYSRISLHP